MSAAVYNIKIEQGATFVRSFTIKDAAGVPIDVSGDTFEGGIRDDFDDLLAKEAFTFDLADANLGTVQLRMEYDVTATLSKLDYPDLKAVYTVNRIKADTTVDRILEGKVTLSLDANIDPEVAP